MRLGLFLSAIVLTTSAHAQSMIDDYQKLSPAEERIFNNGRDNYYIRMYKKDGSELRGSEINRNGLLGPLLMINTGCDAKVLEAFVARRIAHTPYAVAVSKLECTRQSFAKKHLPYTLRLSTTY